MVGGDAPIVHRYENRSKTGELNENANAQLLESLLQSCSRLDDTGTLEEARVGDLDLDRILPLHEPRPTWNIVSNVQLPPIDLLLVRIKRTPVGTATAQVLANKWH